MPRIQPLLYLLIGIGSLVGLYGAYKRWQVESTNRRVELAVDYAEVKQLSELTGQQLSSVLTKLREAGIGSVAITEDALAALEARGSLHVEQSGGRSVVSIYDAGLASRILTSLSERGFVINMNSPGPRGTVFRRDGLSAEVYSAVDYGAIRGLGIDLDPAALRDARMANLQPIARINNWIGVTPATEGEVLKGLFRHGIRTVVFSGTDVLGYRGMEQDTADVLRTVGLRYGQIEFGKQKGDETLSTKLKGEYVRVHSIGEAELSTLDENEIIDRFVRAARERNIRLCYFRLPYMVGADPVGHNADVIGKIVRAISRNGEMEFGPAHVYGETAVPTLLFAIIALGAAAGATLLLLNLVPMRGGAAMLILLAAVCIGLAMGLGETGRKLVALLAAIVFPTLACLRTDILVDRDLPRVNPYSHAIGGLAAASAITALGILQVVGLLATRPFMLKATQFMGIKAAHAAPIVLIAIVAALGIPRLGGWAKVRERAAEIASEPARIGTLILAFAALVALAMIVARTGNEPGVGVSGIELKFRSILDRLLPVRPRTKEFLVGHPAFVMALCFWAVGRRRVAIPLYVVGVIGQVSILNTFCHIHTPLVLSLIRDVTGLVAGAIIGLAAFAVIEKLLPAVNTAAPEPTLQRS